MPKGGTLSAAKAAAKNLAQEMGYEFVDAELVNEHGSAFLRIFIQHERGMDLSLCEAYHKRLNPLVEDLSYDYLEVSSPGLDYPLKSEGDFLRSIGTKITIKLYKAQLGDKEFSGRLLSFQDDEITLDTQRGQQKFLRKDCALVKPMLSFEQKDEEESI